MIFQIDLSPTGLMDGLTATLVVSFALAFGIIIFYQAVKRGASLLKYGAIMAIFTGLFWLGPTTDLLLVILGIGHFENRLIYCILGYMWVFPAHFFAMYIGADLMLPNKKKIILIVSAILGIVFELFLFLDTANAFNVPPPPEGELVDTHFEYGHPLFIFVAIFLVTIFIFLVLGSLRAARKSSGQIRKNFYYLALAFFLFIPIAVLDGLLDPGPILFVIRILMIFVAWLIYLSLRIRVE